MSPDYGYKNDTTRFCKDVDVAVARCFEAAGKSAAPPGVCAGSIGPFGAALSEGEEYTGDYSKAVKNPLWQDCRAASAGSGEPETVPETTSAGSPSEPRLEQFLSLWHRPRFELLAKDERVGLLACETLPRAVEGKALSEMLASPKTNPNDTPGYISFSCSSPTTLTSGEKIKSAVAGLTFSPNLVAVGVNCTDPNFVGGLVEEIKAGLAEVMVTSAQQAVDSGRAWSPDGGDPTAHVQILVKPNSGEIYDGTTKTWREPEAGEKKILTDLAGEWVAQGVTMLGGCCRVYPEGIEELCRVCGPVEML